MDASIREEKNIHTLFTWSVILKGIHAVFEIVVSFVVLFATAGFVNETVLRLTQEELIEDPKDFIANYIVRAAEHFSSSTQLFVFLYLLSHGIIKLVLVYYLLKEKLWAYPAAITFFSLFIAYQIYRYTITQSLWLIVITVFDLVVVWLTVREYRFIRTTTTAL